MESVADDGRIDGLLWISKLACHYVGAIDRFRRSSLEGNATDERTDTTARS